MVINRGPAPRRARTKGKCERRFDHVEKNLLNGRAFRSLAHLNEVTAWWLSNVADVRVHRETRQRPIDRYAEERPQLLPLPAQPYDTAQVLYRIADAEGYVCYQQNLYSVPWRFIGQALPLRITADEVIVYSPAVAEVARHRLFARGLVQQRSTDKPHRPRDDAQEQQTLLRKRFSELAPRPAASSTACCAINATARARRGVCSPCWPATAARTCWPLSSARFASVLTRCRRSNASWRSRLAPKVCSTSWPTTAVAGCNRCWTNRCRRAAWPNISNCVRRLPIMARQTKPTQPQPTTTSAGPDRPSEPA